MTVTESQANPFAPGEHVLTDKQEPEEDPISIALGYSLAESRVNIAQKIAAGFLLLGVFQSLFFWILLGGLLTMVLDIVIGVSILRGNKNFITFAAIRVVAGTLAFSMLFFSGGTGLPFILFQSIGVIGMLGLLYSEPRPFKVVVFCALVLLGMWVVPVWVILSIYHVW